VKLAASVDTGRSLRRFSEKDVTLPSIDRAIELLKPFKNIVECYAMRV
jgi:hypothetical protein